METPLVLSTWARFTIEVETPYTSRHCTELADVTHKFGELGATISSGSFPARAADVTLKERRPLVLVPRETPLSEIQSDLVDRIVMRILDQFDLPVGTADIAERWQGLVHARSHGLMSGADRLQQPRP
ncbi:flavoprotein [Streptomyces sp. NPDC059002]|uniref:flavoprotein n=1 Tax=Streptomyces sp. NPDC059002 TaxID=3346690 RepID=UPI0036A32A88